jgi:hypothetical protein
MNKRSKPIIIKKCHLCHSLIESYNEVQKCPSCKHSFLPSNYFKKAHAKNSQEYALLFEDSSELNEKDLIRGISVLW